MHLNLLNRAPTTLWRLVRLVLIYLLETRDFDHIKDHVFFLEVHFCVEFLNRCLSPWLVSMATSLSGGVYSMRSTDTKPIKDWVFLFW